MKLSKRYGFTTVELIIVITVVVLAAAILIPSYISLTKQNKEKPSADQQIVMGMNNALQSEEESGNKPADLQNVFDILREAGYNVPLEPSSSAHRFYWIKADNRVALVGTNEDGVPVKIEYPDDTANKYKNNLPDEWFCLKVEPCAHDEGFEYVPVALESGGSEVHWVTCAKCHVVISKDEPHEFGDDDICDKCGYKKVS